MSTGLNSPAPAWPDIDPDALATEYDVDPAVMRQFVDRFAPGRVPDGAHAAAADVVLFVHIPKTAGVSVGKTLQECFDTFRGVEWRNIGKSFRQETREAVYQQTVGGGRQVLMGHFGWPQLQLWRNHELTMKCCAIFRDPVARTLSNYNYNSSDAHPARDNFLEQYPTFEAYIEDLDHDVQVTQTIGFVDSFETVLRKYLKYYTFLGVTESLSDSLSHFGRSHGLGDLVEYRQNVGRKASPAEIDPELRERIEARSVNDGRIHQLLSTLFRR